jgi:hypothetical protein
MATHRITRNVVKEKHYLSVRIWDLEVVWYDLPDKQDLLAGYRLLVSA